MIIVMRYELRITKYVFAIGMLLSLVFGFILGMQVQRSDSASSEESCTVRMITNNSSCNENAKHFSQCDVWIDVEGAVMQPGVYCLQGGAMVQDAIESAGGYDKKVVDYRWAQQHLNLSKVVRDRLKIYIPFRDDTVCTLQESELPKKVEEVVSEEILSQRIDKLQSLYEQISRDIGDLHEEKHVDAGNNEETADNDTSEDVSDSDDSAIDDCVNLNTASLEELDGLPGIGASTASKIIDARPYTEPEDIKNVSGIGESKYEQIKDLICL
jgi:competence protein ComEA